MTHSAQEIEHWLVTRLSTLTGLAPEEIRVNEPVIRLGLDSVAVVTLATELEAWLGYRFRTNPLDDHPTIKALARFLAQQIA